MQHPKATLWTQAARAMLLGPLLLLPEPNQLAAQPGDSPQTLLLPGLYLFQTRTRDGSCNDAPRTGYITSAVATIDGVPGADSLSLQLLNSKYWPRWQLTVGADGVISGEATLGDTNDSNLGSSHFELRQKKDRFQGVGTREYPGKLDGKPIRCTLNYDALLKPMDR